MHPFIEALGTTFTHETTEELYCLDSPPFDPEVRKIIRNTKLVVRRRRKTVEFNLFFLKTFKESFNMDYYVVHYLKGGGHASYSRRIHGADRFEESVMTGLYLESIPVVQANLGKDRA